MGQKKTDSFVDEHLLYGLRLDCRPIFGKNTNIVVFDSEFLELYPTFDEEDRFRIYKRCVEKTDYKKGSHYSFYRLGEEFTFVPAPIVIEMEKTDNHIIYVLFGFYCTGLKQVRQFAKANFEYYRIQKKEYHDIYYFSNRSLKIEATDLFYKTLMDQRIDRDKLVR